MRFLTLQVALFSSNGILYRRALVCPVCGCYLMFGLVAPEKFRLQFTIFSMHKRTVQSYFSTSVGKMLLRLKRVDLLLDSVDSSHRHFMYYF